MEKRSRASRFALTFDPVVMRLFSNERGAWHETEAEVDQGLIWGKEKAVLLAWVRKQMDRRLTPVERRCVELYYFHGLTFRQASTVTGTNASSVYRAVRRSVRKLQLAAKEDGIAGRGHRGEQR